jgi:hypothetical protein
MMMKQTEKEYIRELKNDESTGAMIEHNLTDAYKIRVIEKGEHLFYQQGDKALICEIQIRNGSIFSSTIRTWDNDSVVNIEEKLIIIERIKQYFIRVEGFLILFSRDAMYSFL